MAVFDYAAVIVSIVLALGMTQLLAGFANVLRDRDRVVLHWPQLAWSVWLFMFHLQIWWAFWNVRTIDSLGYFQFLSHLLWPVTLYLLSTLAWPDFGEGRIDLAAYFNRQRRAFFGLLIVANVLVAGTAWLAPGPADVRRLLYLIPWVALYLLAIANRNARVDVVLAILALAGMCFWVSSFSPLVSAIG